MKTLLRLKWLLIVLIVLMFATEIDAARVVVRTRRFFGFRSTVVVAAGAPVVRIANPARAVVFVP